MRARTRVWVEENGVDLFGGGRTALLAEVKQTGSLRLAARNLGMSYRAAWGKLKEAERRLGLPLLVRRAGGARGGGSTLSPEGERLLAAFERFEKELDARAQRLLRKHLGFLAPARSGTARR